MSYLSFAIIVLPALALAQLPTALSSAAAGYVVRVDSSDVYLDFDAKSGAQTGQGFMIYKEGDELIHPIDGRALGRMEMQIAEGSVRDIYSGYSVGSIKRLFGRIGSGMRVRLAPVDSAARTQPPGETPSRAPRWKSPVFDFAARGMAVADFKGDRSLQVALAGERDVFLYPYPPRDAKPLARRDMKGVAPKILSLETADLNGNGRAELFVTRFNATFNRVETAVLELDETGHWLQLDDIPWIVRSRQDSQGRRALLAQQLHEDRTFPFSNFYPLIFENGRYVRGRKALPYRGVDWIYAFGTVDFDGTGETVLEITATDRLRLNFKKGHWKTAEAFGATPVRLTWAGQILECHPALPARYTARGFEAIYTVRNIGALGGIAENFGRFSSAEVHRMEFSGLGLSSAWKSRLEGYSPTLVLVATAPGDAQELAVAVVGTQGKSSLWIYDP